ncbi:LemA family protein [Labilibaculum sp. DW002]|uniref:LemA family protein n=1 Tax=Paralabilibaculum antarcticum TaxID=2912572 RepID=A0ABT5VST1_9BACT|nr:LemA family protein [Labilibaculum sp. DW002]MDE5418351.1 LemA family protein [Labilibaculum sp. DW002]
MDFTEIGILAFIFVFIIVLIIIYNVLVKRKNEVNNAFASVDVMLKKRYDLIPNLVEVTKGYMEHERTVFVEITTLRTQVVEEKSDEQKVKTHNEIHRKVNDLLMNVENYPDLKADSSFLALQANWTSSEEHISASRRYYNTAVTEYNNYIQMFPSNIMAKMFGYREKKVFEANEIERKKIKASELFNS